MLWKIPGLICPACEQPQHNGDLCPICASFLEPIQAPCPLCSEPDCADELCGECLQHPPAWQESHIGWHFSGLTRHLIHQFKYHQDMASGYSLIRRFSVPTIATKPDALVAIPMHHRKQAQKGFNQAELIARHLSRQLNIPLFKGVRRQQPTQALEGLTKQERRKVLKHAFVCRVTPPRRIALIDDVMTSGATVQEVAELLHKQGTEHVSVWALARTPL